MGRNEMAKFARMLLNCVRADFLQHLNGLIRQMAIALDAARHESHYVNDTSNLPAIPPGHNWIYAAHDQFQRVRSSLRGFKAITDNHLKYIDSDTSSLRSFLLPSDSFGSLQSTAALAAAAKYETDLIEQLQAVACQRSLYSWKAFLAVPPDKLKPRLSPTGYAVLEQIRNYTSITDGVVFHIPSWHNPLIRNKLGPLYGLLAVNVRPNGVCSTAYYVFACRGATIVGPHPNSIPSCVPWTESHGQMCLGNGRAALHNLILQGQIRPAIDIFISSLATANPDAGYVYSSTFNNNILRRETHQYYRNLKSFITISGSNCANIPGLINPQCEVCKVRIPINTLRSLTHRRLCKHHAQQCCSCLKWDRNDQSDRWGSCTKCHGPFCYNCRRRRLEPTTCLKCETVSAHQTIPPRRGLTSQFTEAF